MKIDYKNGTYRYVRFMRDGSVKELVGVIRSKKPNKGKGNEAG